MIDKGPISILRRYLSEAPDALPNEKHGKKKIAGLESFFFRTYCYSHCCPGQQTMGNVEYVRD